MAGAPRGNNNAKGNKGGAPRGNKNAVGNKGGARQGNLNALTNGNYYDPTKHLEKDFIKKYIPAATMKIIKGSVESGITNLEILWTNIQIQFAAILRSQKIMYVKNKSEMIKELKKVKVEKEIYENKKTKENEPTETYREEEFEFQFAWDRQATFLTSQSKAMTTLQNMIDKYEQLLHKNWEQASEEQKLRIDKLKYELKELTGEGDDKNKNVSKLDSILKQMKDRKKDE